MLTLPPEIMLLIDAFAPVFNERVWEWAKVLLVGAMLTPGKRTVSAVLRVMGLSQERQYQNYHRVLNRATWCSLAVSRILLGLLVAAFGQEELVLGADETLERRVGEKIRCKGMFRDPIRSSKKYPVISPGLRWLSLMLLTPVPWAARRWALPFLTVLTTSQKADQQGGRRHKTSSQWVRQLVSQVRRWQPKVRMVLVVDGALAAVRLAWQCVGLNVICVSRLRLDAQLYDWPDPARRKPGPKPTKGRRQIKLAQRLTHPDTPWQRLAIPWYGGAQRALDVATAIALWHRPGQPPLPIRWVLVRDPLGKLHPAAFFATDLEATPTRILHWVVMRWSVEVTFQELRTHLGFETQRQWSDRAIARTTPALFGLFSLITLLAYRLTAGQPLPVRAAAWYCKTHPSFADAIALVRRSLWANIQFRHSPVRTRLLQFPDTVIAGLVDTLCYLT